MRLSVQFVAPLAILAAGCQSVPSTACTPIAFGKFNVGQKITAKDVAGLTRDCSAANDCRYTGADNIQYVVVSGLLREKSAPAAKAGVPDKGGDLDSAFAAKISAGRCAAFTTTGGYEDVPVSLTTPETKQAVTGYPVRTTVYRDDMGKLMVAITSLPEI